MSANTGSVTDPSLVVNLAPADVLKYNLTSLGVVSIKGANPYGVVATDFRQPDVGQPVQVTFDSTGWLTQGQAVLIDYGGSYQVQSVDSTTKATLINLGYAGNAILDFTIIAGSKAHPAGFQGLTGSKGDKGDQGEQGEVGPAAIDMSTFQLDAGSQYRFSVQLLQEEDDLATNLNPDQVDLVQFIALPSLNSSDASAYWNKVTPHPDVKILNPDTGLIRLWVQGSDTVNLAGTRPVCLVRTYTPSGVRETPAEFQLVIV